jgi:hypothetical protein
VIIITAASDVYFPFLVNMLGSAHKHNFVDLSKIIVYDIGLKPSQVDFLQTIQKVEIHSVPPFCPHWRQWFTWKPYCIKNAMETETDELFLWLDAGTEILSDLNEIFKIIDTDGYFFVGLDEFRTNEIWTTKECFEILNLDRTFFGPKNQIGAFCMGFKKSSPYYKSIVLEAFKYCQIEKAIAPQPSCPNNRHDQSIYSLLAAKENCDFHEQEIYGEWQEIVPGKHQVIYSCRRKRPFVNFSYIKYNGSGFSHMPGYWWMIIKEMVISFFKLQIYKFRKNLPGPIKQIYRKFFPKTNSLK